MATELTPKRLELLSELVPQSHVIALLVNPKQPNTERIDRETCRKRRARRGCSSTVLKASTEGEIDAAFAALVQRQAGALIVGNDPFFDGRRRAARGAGVTPCRSGDLLWREFASGRRPDQLWTEPHG